MRQSGDSSRAFAAPYSIRRGRPNHVTGRGNQASRDFLTDNAGALGTAPRSPSPVSGGLIERDEEGKLIYLRNLSDHGVLEGYEFRHESLVRGQYILLQRPINGLNEFVDYYRTLKELLTARYGDPTSDQTVWDNDLYQPVPDYWGVAVLIGHLHYHAAWETPEGAITLELTGNRHSRLFLEHKNHREGAHT